MPDTVHSVGSAPHFWTGLNSVTRFNVVYQDVECAICDGYSWDGSTS